MRKYPPQSDITTFPGALQNWDPGEPNYLPPEKKRNGNGAHPPTEGDNDPEPAKKVYKYVCPERLTITPEEYHKCNTAPPCIMKDRIWTDVRLKGAPGGVGKTTLTLLEAIYIINGIPFFGAHIERPGPVVIITAEDSRERLIAITREIATANYLKPSEITEAMNNLHIWDISGEIYRLVAQDGSGNIVQTDFCDFISERFCNVNPSLMVFDPCISFGAGERFVNDNEQGLISASRKIVRNLKTCAELVHHTGKTPAATKDLGQYALRGGSALVDGARMVNVLYQYGINAKSEIPKHIRLEPNETAICMAQAKCSYGPPKPYLWIKRSGYRFSGCPSSEEVNDKKAAALADQIEARITIGLGMDVPEWFTGSTLETKLQKEGEKREDVREALETLVQQGRVTWEQLPPQFCRGARQKYLYSKRCSISPDSLFPFGEISKKRQPK